MLSTLPLMALFLVQYTMVTIEAPTPTLGGSTASISSSADLENELGDLVIPQQESAKNTSNSGDAKARAVTTDYTSLLDQIDDFQFPSNITVGHMTEVAKYVQRHLSIEMSIANNSFPLDKLCHPYLVHRSSASFKHCTLRRWTLTRDTYDISASYKHYISYSFSIALETL